MERGFQGTATVVSRRGVLVVSIVMAVSVAFWEVVPGAESGRAPLMAFVGTFSSPLREVLPTQVDLPPGNGRGIHLFEIDRATGAMKPCGIYEVGTSPSCLVLNPAGTRMYCANETDRVGDSSGELRDSRERRLLSPALSSKGGEGENQDGSPEKLPNQAGARAVGDHEGTVSAFAINATNGQLTLLNTVPSGGAGPTYVSIHPSGKFVLVANYFGGSVAVLPVLSDGRLGAAMDIKQDAGTIGPRKPEVAPEGSFAFSGHDRTHAHMIQADASGRFVLHVDLGLDRIFVWKFDEGSGVLRVNDPPAVTFPPGSGPRHIFFHLNGRWCYSLQEEASNVVVFDYDAANGRLSSRQTISSLPPGFAGSNFASEIMVSADGRFVYVGNRLHDSIGILRVGSNGELSFVGEEWTRGNYPRSFNFAPSGRFLYCCNQRADNVTIFRVDRKTGGLRFTGHYAAVGNPSSIVFLDLVEQRNLKNAK